MLFNSLEFLVVFLPITTFGFWVCRRCGDVRWVILWLFACSLVFYGAWEPSYVLLILGSIAFNYAAAMRIARTRSRWTLGMAIAVNVAVLGYFKYANFILLTYSTVSGTDFHPVAIILPLGISFVTFIQIAFLVDVYNDRTDDLGLPKYALFVSYFPHLIAGPIIHHKEVMSQFTNERIRSVSQSDVVVGLSFIVIGLFKKVIMADTLTGYASLGFRLAADGQPISFFDAWGAVLAFTFQIYFDFSGYSDIAIGLSRLFGIRLPINFNSPYKSGSIIEFWRRWHITLSRFLRDYVYIPLGGNRGGGFRRYLNLLAVMLIGGLWHGASWLFVVWGGLHGVYLVVNHAFRYVMQWPTIVRSGLPRILVPASSLLAFPAVVFAWVFFRANTWGGAMVMLHAMRGANGVLLPERFQAFLGPFRDTVMQLFHMHTGDLVTFHSLRAILWVAMSALFVLLLPNSQQLLARFKPALDQISVPDNMLYRTLTWRPSPGSAVVTALVAIVVLLKIYIGTPGEFIYFQF
ncbi:MAG TPA: MBOAT family O-acyltransferase [Bradyrhizobium sp.]|jgi:alginate O-acetyltransferase complex protein AlgI|uniref:MBOAT family O-acyltransferase n=1 Tax=Bradyrhizobium sp. TaxID=376 RepID=UPI002C890434|nr:MBOAT family O-acyltransferase [Bradyrhizobium sp.]HTB04899.1 MBOAT family O-acyltransferase [Bradyrhizobium sp.]